MLAFLLILAAEGGQEQAGEPDKDDASRRDWVREPAPAWEGPVLLFHTID